MGLAALDNNEDTSEFGKWVTEMVICVH